jgi:two-component system, NarL family, nitrate/nitrite response regulator NarL
VRVLVVAEIRLYRDGVADALRRVPDVAVPATAGSGAAAVMAARRTECDLALLDMTLHDSTTVVAALLAARRGLKVVALGVAEDGPDVVACAEAGVAGYVPRDATLEELVAALRAALRGEVSCSGRVAARLINHIALQATARRVVLGPVPLTTREREVLDLLETGMSNKQIAGALDIQLSTVKNHVHNVLGKYGVATRRQVAASDRGLPVDVPIAINAHFAPESLGNR